MKIKFYLAMLTCVLGVALTGCNQDNSATAPVTTNSMPSTNMIPSTNMPSTNH